MLTQHTYFNLDAYRDPSTDKVWDHTLHLPYSSRYLEADQGALPTGKILTAAKGSINDFASSPNLTLGHARDQPGFEGNCGADGAVSFILNFVQAFRDEVAWAGELCNYSLSSPWPTKVPPTL